MKADEDFIAAKFFDFEIPKDKQWLMHYFDTEVQYMFLKYYLIFNSVYNFVDHTGYYAHKRFLLKLAARYRKLTRLHKDASSIFDDEHMQLIMKLEEGKLKKEDL